MIGFFLVPDGALTHIPTDAAAPDSGEAGHGFEAALAAATPEHEIFLADTAVMRPESDPPADGVVEPEIAEPDMAEPGSSADSTPREPAQDKVITPASGEIETVFLASAAPISALAGREERPPGAIRPLLTPEAHDVHQSLDGSDAVLETLRMTSPASSLPFFDAAPEPSQGKDIAIVASAWAGSTDLPPVLRQDASQTVWPQEVKDVAARVEDGARLASDSLVHHRATEHADFPADFRDTGAKPQLPPESNKNLQSPSIIAPDRPHPLPDPGAARLESLTSNSALRYRRDVWANPQADGLEMMSDPLPRPAQPIEAARDIFDHLKEKLEPSPTALADAPQKFVAPGHARYQMSSDSLRFADAKHPPPAEAALTVAAAALTEFDDLARAPNIQESSRPRPGAILREAAAVSQNVSNPANHLPLEAVPSTPSRHPPAAAQSAPIAADMSGAMAERQLTPQSDRTRYAGQTQPNVDEPFHSQAQDAAAPRLDEPAGPVERPAQLANPVSLPNPPLLAKDKAVIDQLRVRLSEAGPGQHILHLTPEELGSVGFRITHDETGVTIMISAERPEIMQMMRRHAELLMHDLAEHGLGDAQLEFDQGDGRSPTPDHPQVEKRAPKATAPTAETPAQIRGSLNIRM
ncbi:MAG: flagellar hook-length control protein FliK [Paracoccus sp. (in: a-proteobacteria)]|nr:flagellar hook-length control protein FliK [Paracoccus sp. (in: a-proteobacteria)]